MKRPPSSFVVEHKRRPRSAKTEPVSLWSGDLGRELRDLLKADASEPSETPAAESAPSGPTPGNSAPAAPPKRILEAQPEPSLEAPEEMPSLSEEPKERRPRGRPRKVPVEAAPPVDLVPEPAPLDEAEDLADEDVPLAAEAPPAPLASPNHPTRLSYHERRRAARRELPLGERWRWNRKY